MTEMSCEGFLYSVIFPYLGTHPLGLILSFIGPVGYVFKNSFGKVRPPSHQHAPLVELGLIEQLGKVRPLSR
jgi:hypothetical protein